MIEQIGRELEARLNELLHEVEKLRRALIALGPLDGKRRSSGSAPASKATGARTRTAPPASTRSGAQAAAKPTRARTGARGSALRTKPGATKAAILHALEGAEAMTAGELASATGIVRATTSTTLSRLAAAGEITKAERGYTLNFSNGTTAAS